MLVSPFRVGAPLRMSLCAMGLLASALGLRYNPLSLIHGDRDFLGSIKGPRMSSSANKTQTLRAPRGMADTLPEQMPLIRLAEETARRVFEIYSYTEIRTPMFEDTRLFVRGIGEATDIVEKEMYTFGNGDESLTLRPEATAPVVRAYLEHNMHKTGGFQKLYYIGPMFRHERPQAGRMRQFSQMGVEAIGSDDPAIDAETMLCAMQFFRELGLADCVLRVNTIGNLESRAAYRELLREFLAPHLPAMCEDCQSRFERNVFRLLDCKQKACKAITRTAPPMREHLGAECREHFEAVLAALDAAGQAYDVDDHLVRGFDYYTRTVYEISNPILGARDAVCGGGRYDNLVADIGGPPTGAAGFAIGLVPTLLALTKQNREAAPPKPSIAAYVAAIDDDSRATCFQILQTLRTSGIAADMDFQCRSMKAQMRAAGRVGAKFTIVVGPDERSSGEFTVKDMTGGNEQRARLEMIADIIRPSNQQDL